MKDKRTYHAGWVFMADLSGRRGCESQGNMPVLIISTELHNVLSDSVVVIPCTQQISHADWEQHVAIFAEDKYGVQSPIIAMTEHVTEIDKSRLGKCIGKVNASDYTDVINNLVTYTIK